MKKINLFFIFLFATTVFLFCGSKVNAEELTPDFEGALKNSIYLTDENYDTAVTFKKGDTISLGAKDGKKIKAVYIVFNSPVEPYSIKTDSEEIECGKNGFLHDYTLLSEPTENLQISFKNSGVKVSRIRVFSDDEVPKDVQIWEPTPDMCDIMIFSAHADDEILFFGSFITPYACETDAKVVVAYMTEFWSTTPVREHEKLDGLWTAGLKYYPICGNFYDVYSADIDTARSQYDYEAMVDFAKQSIEKYQPQVVVTHDFKGEYGHGYHMLTNDAVINAVEAASFKVPKTYIHLYPENEIFIDLRTPIKSMENRTALDILKDAYKQHVSQQWCWFYVDDEYEYSCSRFGLYRTLVGKDTSDDVLCNIKTYATQENEKKLEEERIRKEEEAKAEAERLRSEEENKLKELAEEEARQAEKNREIGIILSAIFAFVLVLLYLLIRLKRKRRHKGK